MNLKEKAKDVNKSKRPAEAGKEVKQHQNLGRRAEPKSSGKPSIYVWGVKPVGPACKRLYEELARSGLFYRNASGEVAELQADILCGETVTRLVPLAASEAVSTVEAYAEFWKSGEKGDVPTCLTTAQADVVLHSPFRRLLPMVLAVQDAPLLHWDAKERRCVFVERGYVRETATYVTGRKPAPSLPLDKAGDVLAEPVEECDYVSAADAARALGAMLTHALQSGGFLNGPAPMFLYLADDSQAGKTSMARCVPAIYGAEPALVTQREGGVGSMDESINAALASPSPFLLLDNLRNNFDSAHLEAVLSNQGPMEVRFLRGSALVDIRRKTFLASSNGYTTSRDLVNRTVLVRIRKRKGYKFNPLLPHQQIALRPTRYLAAVHALVRAWAEAGCPRAADDRLPFCADWAGAVNWMARELLGLEGHILDGMFDDANALSSHGAAIVRNIVLAARANNRLGEWVNTSELLLWLMDRQVNIRAHLPKRKDDAIGLGALLAGVFHSRETVLCEGLHFQRADTGFPSRSNWLYAVSGKVLKPDLNDLRKQAQNGQNEDENG